MRIFSYTVSLGLDLVTLTLTLTLLALLTSLPASRTNDRRRHEWNDVCLECGREATDLKWADRRRVRHRDDEHLGEFSYAHPD